MSIATKTGDAGTTGLMYGRRVSKSDLRIDACGTVDEVNTALGLARASNTDPYITERLFEIQKELVTLMGELAVLPEDRPRYEEKGHRFVNAAMVDRLTSLIDDLEQNKNLTFKHWATPGYNLASATLEVARTTTRRAERRVVEFSENGTPVNPQILRYLNRLSDLCWLYARYIESTVEATPSTPEL